METLKDAQDVKLRRLARGHSSARSPYEDLLQEARIAAWKADRLPNAAGKGAGALRAAKRAIVRYEARERREAHRRLGQSGGYRGLSAATVPDFAPALLDALEERDACTCIRAEAVARVAAAQARCDRPLVRRACLTGAERTVLTWLCRGLEHDEIAGELACSARMVRFHLAQVYRKLGCRNRIELYNAAMRQGLVDPPRKES